ncbi:MAG: hypothetical protein IPI37_04860 [Bacteroidales bacterium]|nr:hypothetical protein [Bacteroidales bacterium]
MLSMDDNDFLTMLIAPGEKIEVKAERNSMARPSSVTGSRHFIYLAYRKDPRTRWLPG